MNKTLKDHPSKQIETGRALLRLKPKKELDAATAAQFHVIGKGIICGTDYRAPQASPLELVLDATEGFIPLWAQNMVLRWKFNEPSLAVLEQPEAIKSKIRSLLTGALKGWGDAAPVRFTEEADNSDFEIVLEQNDSCNIQGCVLAQGFFPDAGRHQMYIYPKMFEQSLKEQTETLEHEIGHIFGLRHFFAPKTETRWPSEIFGKQKAFTIMNYGTKSLLTSADKSDLKKLYASVWSGQLTKINGTPIKLVQPFHYFQG